MLHETHKGKRRYFLNLADLTELATLSQKLRGS
jgi:hypothetical protein